MCVYHQHVGRVYKDGRVAIDDRRWPGGSKKDILGHLLNIEKIRARPWRERLRPSRPMHRDLQDRQSREEIAPRWTTVLTHKKCRGQYTLTPIFDRGATFGERCQSILSPLFFLHDLA